MGGHQSKREASEVDPLFCEVAAVTVKVEPGSVSDDEDSLSQSVPSAEAMIDNCNEVVGENEARYDFESSVASDIESLSEIRKAEEMEKEAILAKLLREKAQDLPLLCVETICKFTPTSKLIRLYSNAVPLPGAFWNLGLEAVLQKRLPLSVNDDPAYQQAQDGPVALLDAAGAKIATIKLPAAFRFSPLNDSVESATLSVGILRTVVKSPAQDFYLSAQRSSLQPLPFRHQRQPTEKFQLQVAHAATLLSELPNVTELTLALRGVRSARGVSLSEKEALASTLKQCLPRLESFSVIVSDNLMNSPMLDTILGTFVRDLPILENLLLKRLNLPGKIFGGVMEMTDNGAVKRPCTRRVLSGLSSLGIWQGELPESPAMYRDVLSFDSTYDDDDDHDDGEDCDVLSFVSTYCSQLSALFLFINGEHFFRSYLDVFRALTGLNTLGLNIDSICWKEFNSVGQMKELTFKERDTISSVTDLRLTWRSLPRSHEYAIASLFPNAVSVAFQHDGQDRDSLDLASEFCARRVLSSAAVLRRPSHQLVRFLNNPYLPGVVDLSQITFECIVRDARLLKEIYCAMAINSIKSLRLAGPVHPDALQRLQAYVALHGHAVTVSAWTDRDLVEHLRTLNFAEFMDIKIGGTKTGGSLKGEQFTIRVLHRLNKRVGIFH